MPPAARRIPVLLVESRKEQADSLATGIAAAGIASRIEQVAGVSESLERLAARRFGVVMMDVKLVDRTGVAAIGAIREQAPATPVLVVSDTEDPDLAAEAVAAGAQDYVVRGQIAPTTLRRVIRCAIERQRRERIAGRQRGSRGRARELVHLDELAAPAPTNTTGALYGQASLRASAPDRFEAFVTEYQELLTALLEERAFKVDHGVSERARALARQIGALRGGARDVVELHTTALRQHLPGAGRSAAGVMTEGRLLALQLMGYLVAYYRARATWSAQ